MNATPPQIEQERLYAITEHRGNGRPDAHPAHSESHGHQITLLDSLEGNWLKLPEAIMRDCGSATQTLGGLLAITNRETFVSQSRIAAGAHLPISTVRKHLVRLHDSGWIENGGRENLKPYGFLPIWACHSGQLRWSARAVLSVWMARLCSLKSACDVMEGCYTEDVESLICDDEDRFRYSLKRLKLQTGLSRNSIIEAKRTLRSLGIITSTQSGRAGDLLLPNFDFQAVVTPCSNGRAASDLDGGCKSGHGGVQIWSSL